MFIKKLKNIGATSLILTSIGLTACTNRVHQESTGQLIDSTAITAKVKAKFLADKSIQSLPITVITYKNTVQLSGFVENLYQKHHAVEVAESVPGVINVEDSLVIKTH